MHAQLGTINLASRASIAILEAVVSEAVTSNRSRPKSEVRRRTVLVGVRLLPDEHDRLMAVAEARGVSVAALLRSTAIEHTDSAPFADSHIEQ